MKTKFLFGAAIVAMLNCTLANADLLGGSLGGNLNSTRDIGLTGHGNGSFGADFDPSPLRRTTSDVADRTKQRTRDTVSATRERTTAAAATAKSLDPEVAAEGNASVKAKK